MAFDGVLRWSEGRWIAVAWQGGFALLSPSVGLPVAGGEPLLPAGLALLGGALAAAILRRRSRGHAPRKAAQGRH